MLSWLRLPEVHGLELDDPSTTLLHRDILLNKSFLKALYTDWYGQFQDYTPPVDGYLLEIGSGGGFLKEVIPSVVTSDILPLPHVDQVFSAETLPFEANSLRAVYMLNTLHHIPRSLKFLAELERCLVPGGRMICIEPANTLLSRQIYTHVHHEPFDPKGGLELKPGCPLSNSNQALPWILFVRDWAEISKLTPELRLHHLSQHTPLSFILSGGFSFRTLVPSSSYPTIRGLERLISPLDNYLGMFMTIVLEKNP